MMTSKRLNVGVLASGRGTDLQSLIDAHQEGRIMSRVAVVLSDNPEARALERARRHEIPAHAIQVDPSLTGMDRRREHDKRLVDALKQCNVQLVVLAGYMRVVTPTLLDAFPERVLNIHPSLLPSFPGLNAQRQALEWGARLAGCTTHLVDEEMDHGPILLQAAVRVHPEDDEAALSRRILAAEHQILPRSIHLIENDRVRIDGRRVTIEPDGSWASRYPTIPGVLYGPGY